MDALIGHDGHGPRDLGQEPVSLGGEGLFDEGVAFVGAGRQVRFDVRFRPALVGIRDEGRIRRSPAYGADPLEVTFRAAELHLQDRALRRLGGRLGHGLGRAEADRVGGGHGLPAGQARGHMSADAGALRVQVPEGAIDRVPGGACRHDGLKRLPRQSALDPGSERLDGCRDALDRLSVARVGHAFPASDGPVLRDRGCDHGSLGARAAGDGELARNGKAVDGNGELTHSLGFLLELHLDL